MARCNEGIRPSSARYAAPFGPRSTFPPLSHSRSAWGTSEKNRRARFYTITAAGRRQLTAEAELWTRTVSIVNRLLSQE